MNSQADVDLYRTARRRVARKIGFLIHLFVFLTVNAGLWAINEAQGGYRWSVWPFSGWALGLGIHGLVTLIGLAGTDLKQRMVEQEMVRLQRQR